MPKILKTVTAEKIYSFPAYERFVASGKYFGEYNSLASELYSPKYFPDATNRS